MLFRTVRHGGAVVVFEAKPSKRDYAKLALGAARQAPAGYVGPIACGAVSAREAMDSFQNIASAVPTTKKHALVPNLAEVYGYLQRQMMREEKRAAPEVPSS